MGWLQKKNNPTSERERKLQEEIQRLETQIRNLAAAAHSEGVVQAPAETLVCPNPVSANPAANPAVSSQPAPVVAPRSGGSLSTPPSRTPQDQVFEAVDHSRLESSPQTVSKALYNELGVRKYDLPGAWNRVKGHLRGESPQNQKFVKLLAAGNIQGLRPLRYEKRVARRRFIALVLVLFLLLWGIAAMFLRH